MKDDTIYNLFLMAFWSDYSYVNHECVQDEYAYNINISTRVFKMLKDLMPEGEKCQQELVPTGTSLMADGSVRFEYTTRYYNYITESE